MLAEATVWFISERYQAEMDHPLTVQWSNTLGHTGLSGQHVYVLCWKLNCFSNSSRYTLEENMITDGNCIDN